MIAGMGAGNILVGMGPMSVVHKLLGDLGACVS